MFSKVSAPHKVVGAVVVAFTATDFADWLFALSFAKTRTLYIVFEFKPIAVYVEVADVPFNVPSKKTS